MTEKVRDLDEEPQILVTNKVTQSRMADIKDESDAAAVNASEAGDNSTPISSDPKGDSTSPTTQAVVPSSPQSPPNGGVRAWLQVLGSFCLYFNTWGKLHILVANRWLSK